MPYGGTKQTTISEGDQPRGESISPAKRRVRGIEVVDRQGLCIFQKAYTNDSVS